MIRSITRLLMFLSVATLTEAFASLGVGGTQISLNKFFSALLLVFVAAQMAAKPRRPPPNVKNIWIVALALAAIPSLTMSLIVTGDVGSVVNGAITTYSVVLFYFLLVVTIRDERDIDLVIWGVFLGAGLTGLTSVLGVGKVGGGYHERVGGFGGNPNLAALNAVMGLAFGMYLFLANRSGMRRLVVGAVMTVQVVALLYTVSRAGIVCLMVLGGFVMVRSRRLDLLRWAVPALLLIGIGVWYFAPETYFERMVTIEDEADDLAGGSLENKRVFGWYVAVQAFLSHPITGVGIRSYQDFVTSYDPTIGTLTPHSSYLRVAATMGLVGFIPWIATHLLSYFDFSRVRRLTRRHRGDPRLRGLDSRAVFLQGAFVAWMVGGLVTPFEWDKGPWLLYAMSTSIAYLASERSRLVREGRAEEEPLAPEPREIASPFAPGSLPAPRAQGS